MKKITIDLILLLFIAATVSGQSSVKYTYSAQKNFIPVELGKVYLGMPLKDFARQLDLSKGEVDSRFEHLSIDLTFEKGSISGLVIKVAGVGADEKAAIVTEETVKKKSFGNETYETTVQRLSTENIPAKAFVYAMYLSFKEDFDLKTYVLAKYGKKGEVRKPDDQYHFFDIQWVKTTTDKLQWLIRSFHESESRSLQLLGRIDGTEWSLEDYR